ncbi:MAG TPA: DUF2069 domain-containing protein [Rhodanobacteraceae bacterium]|jgi:uncharacterized membrane protein|nr:DUF2069 domain-containing protein [Rhodanobacteraceae bacterium]
MNPILQRRIGFAAWAALALLQIVWHAWLLPPARMPVAAALVFALLPLAVPLVYWRTPARALLVAGMIALLYFCHGVAEAWAAPHERVFACIEIALTVSVILACARMPRRRGSAGAKLGP